MGGPLLASGVMVSDLPDVVAGNALDRLPPDFHELPRAQKLDALLSQDDAAGLIRALPAYELLLVVRDIGLSDCTDVVAMTSTSQRISFIDLDCWNGEELDVGTFDYWLDLLRIASLPALVDTLGNLDPEMLADYLLQHVHYVLDRSQEDEILAAEQMAPVVYSPDQQFVLVLNVLEDQGGEERIARIRSLLDLLYRHDEDAARALLMLTRSGLRIENEELAYRFRQARLSDLGFPATDEAHILYAPIRLDAVKSQLSQRVPSPDHELPLGWALVRARTGDFLERCLAGAADRAGFMHDFGLAVNRAVVAARAQSSLRNPDRIVDIARHVRATVSIGLEHLSDADPERGAELLQRSWVVQLFQVGHALMVERARRARELHVRAGTLLGEPLESLITGLLYRPQPLYTEQPGELPRQLTSLDELGIIDKLLAEGEAQVAVFEEAFGFSLERFREHAFEGLPEHAWSSITFQTLARTLLAHVAIGGSPSFEALEPDMADTLRQRLDEVPRAAETLGAQLGATARAVLAEAAASLLDEMRPLSPDASLAPLALGVLLMRESA